MIRISKAILEKHPDWRDTRLNAAGIYNIKGAVSPLALGVQPIPGDAGGVLHNGQALAAQLIEQHGLAHVGAAHNGN